MSVAAVRLNDYLTETPESTAAKLSNKALAFNVLEKIFWVAFLAILGVVFTASYAGVALTGHLPLALTGATLLTPCLGFFIAAPLNAHASECTRDAELEESVNREFIAISNWKTPEIEQFFRDHHLNINLLNLDLLRRKNPEEPLCALLPLIARFRVIHRLETKVEQASRAVLASQVEKNHKRLISLHEHQVAYIRHECEAIPLGLDAALLLHLIENPHWKFRIADLGTYRAKHKDERCFDRERGNDDYFIFNSDLNRQPITLAAIEQDMAPRALRLLLFPVRS